MDSPASDVGSPFPTYFTMDDYIQCTHELRCVSHTQSGTELQGLQESETYVVQKMVYISKVSH